eukprot:Gregarina_sp_Poly_1__3052@NODE_1859_length_3191_cov_124_216709_g1204_i0_p4_GENE_NODE_1859_length_3191_cov_124_216709_g1204_i0NODE_1859_length_3191_cov_124_216709_g1204_i0_p4_ORF_typecomplete_len105_score12_71LpxD/PF04613_14/1_9LpxD/PF04613_14/2_5e02_NODE_1859_length_3191_cov_124_216709_g1204_i0265579
MLWNASETKYEGQMQRALKLSRPVTEASAAIVNPAMPSTRGTGKSLFVAIQKCSQLGRADGGRGVGPLKGHHEETETQLVLVPKEKESSPQGGCCPKLHPNRPN